MSTSLPLVSVVTVTYNAQEFLEETLLSVISQSYPAIEFLIIDGGSTDGTLEIVEKYRDKVDVFVSEPDDGIYDAMNKGIRRAKGEWLNFLNAGDVFASNDIIDKLTQNLKNPETDIIAGDRYVLENGEKILQTAKGIEDFWTKGSPCFHQSMFIRKRAIADRGYNLCYKLSADYEFMVRSVAEKKNFDFVHFPLSIFLEGGASKQQVIRSQIEAIKILLDYAPDENIIRNNIFFQGLVKQNYKAVTEKGLPKLIRSNPQQNMNGKKILVVDPIFRGSRLFYSWMIASDYAKRGYQVDIVSRSFAMTEHYHELFDDIAHNLYDGISVSKEFWFEILTQKHVLEILERIKILESRNSYEFIYFAGLNELYPNFFRYLVGHTQEFLFDKKMVFIEYDVRHIVKEKYFLKLNHLKNPSKTVKQQLSSRRYFNERRSLLFSFVNRYSKTKIGVLDERMNNKHLSKIITKSESKHFFYLPDPGPEIMIDNDEKLSGKTKILIVGLQSRRKGMDQLIKLLRYKKSDTVEFVLVGRLTDETEKYRKFIEKSNAIIWHEGFFSEEEIQKYYAKADYVFLPYSPDFTSSSGVLAYATAFGKPVIATHHGLIGYKVKQYRLGYSYPYNKIKRLYSLLLSLPNRESELYQEVSQNCIEYANAHSITAHQKQIRNILKDE